MAELKVTQIKSSIGTKPKHRGTLRALGLRGIGKTNTLPDRPEIRGMKRSSSARPASEDIVKIHDLKPAEGSNRRRKRVGRGIGGKGGKTAGRGTKGQGARTTIPARFEGGQMPLHMRVPKLRGFNNPFRVEYQAINLDSINESGLDIVDPVSLLGKSLVGKGALVKVLGRGEISRPVTVRAHAFSKSAEAAITAAGGTVEIIPLPWGERRPPAKGNQFTNR
jgi:large subunit ribosomal protein L15